MHAAIYAPRLKRPLHVKSVRYIWSTPDGSVHHGSTVVTAETKSGVRQALRSFWLTNNHLQPAEVA
jgi:hypothetical protein